MPSVECVECEVAALLPVEVVSQAEFGARVSKKISTTGVVLSGPENARNHPDILFATSDFDFYVLYVRTVT